MGLNAKLKYYFLPIVALSLIVIFVIFTIRSRVYAPLSSVASPISARGTHSVAIMEDGSLWAWGYNAHGQLGDGTRTARLIPTWIIDDVIAVSDGRSSHNLAIKSDGSLWGWGSNIYGELGIGGTLGVGYEGDWGVFAPFYPLNQPSIEGPILQPARVMNNTVAVSTGANYSIALREDGVLFGWGNNHARWLPNNSPFRFRGSPENRFRHDPNLITLFPERMKDNVVAISAGATHAMAIDNNGILWGWGENNFGQVGEYEFPSIRSGTGGLQIMDSVIAVSAGGWHTAAITEDGSLWTWGNNSSGQLGNGTRSDYDVSNPNPERIMNEVIAVSAGSQYTMAISKNGELWAWGSNSFGQLGDGTTEDRTSPTWIMDNVTYVSTGDAHTLVIRTDGSLWAWGENRFGQLGDGTTINRYSPTLIIEYGLKTP